MSKRITLVVTAALLCLTIHAQPSLSDLKVNHLVSPTGINPAGVQFSWIVNSSAKNVSQQAYEITVSSNGKTVWKSGKTNSDNSTAVIYGGPIASDTRYDWTVRVWDNDGKVSKPAKSSFSTGITPSEWKAEWIGQANEGLKEAPKPIEFKYRANVAKKVKSATAYITARGVYESFINGKRVGNDYLTPGWTAYTKRLQYQAYDVTSLLAKGENEIDAIVAPGWHASGLVWGDTAKRFRYGTDVSLLFQLNITYTDGSKETICSGSDWQMSADGCRIADATIYDGETIDNTAKVSWTDAAVMNHPKDILDQTMDEPVRVWQVRKPVKVLTTPKGEKVIDFGQNLVGWEKVRLQGAKGQKVVISHAEVLDGDGNFYTTNLRAAKALSTYILAGNGVEEFEPCHTFYGFRYIKVEGLDGELNPDDFEAVVVNSGFEDIGTFACSNPVINQLQSNISWGFHGNFVDIPTDCPQRDERLGWTGDAEVFFRTASFLGDVGSFFHKWMTSLADDQHKDGGIPRVIPDCFPDSESTFAAGWADCATIIPWQQYQAYGDIEILRQQYPSMKAWVDKMVAKCRHNGFLLNNYDQPYGDWLFWSRENDPSGKSAVTSPHLIAQCFFAGSADYVRQAAEVLGQKTDAIYYADIAAQARKAYMNEYVSPNGLVSSNTQTAYVTALFFDMLPENLREQAAARLVANIKEYKYHITTGFIGTPRICEVLTKYGYTDVAYKLLLQETCPSWIYPIKCGATTIWERWNSIQPDGRIIGGMNSFNHYSYGAIGDWLYRYAVGIRETAPGYRSFEVDPHAGGNFTWMEASTKSPYGLIKARWEAADNKITALTVTVPVGTTAKVHTPSGKIETVGSGTWTW